MTALPALPLPPQVPRASLGLVGTGLVGPELAWPPNRAVRIVARDIRRHDAVGEFCLQLADLLSSNGVPAQLHAENWNSSQTPDIQATDSLARLMSQQDIVFFHLSTEDPALLSIARLPCRKLLYFHGITPPSFFEAYDPPAAARCRAGIAQSAWARRFDLLMCNSQASARALRTQTGKAALGDVIVCPPVLGIERWLALPNEPAPPPPAERFILFVGRRAPNKGLHRLLSAFRSLAASEPRTNLVLVGNAVTPGYDREIHALAQSIAAEFGERVFFREEVSMATLRGLYESATLFVTMSEHEGFCVPVLEAMQFGLPVLAGTDAAIGELLAGVGCLLNADPAASASILARGLDDLAWRGDIRARQQARFSALATQTDGRLVWQALERLLRLDAGPL
jgi:glycosyltransferase involved in cell wall biosynthesis